MYSRTATGFHLTISCTSWASATGRCARRSKRALGKHKGPLTLDTALKLAQDSHNEAFTRLVYEYLPLTFSRRHGDPSRPWNHFSITLKNGNGLEYLHYQGNWRDIFQNWEALAVSFPGYIESFIAKFVNASTADGHNAYRISREGIDWETLDPGNSWSNIGYWGDHQVVYLLRLLELSRDYHPGLLGESLTRDIFVYADVPYRIKPYQKLLEDPRNTVEYDHDRARDVARRVADIGADGKLVTLKDGSIYRVNLLEKLLVSALARIANLVPGGGIWMNTQRPEWNDANNALVGYGLSMVTLCYLRRYLRLLSDLLQESAATSFDVSRELAQFFRGAGAVLKDHAALLERPVSAAGRKSFMDGMGSVNDAYRARVYRGLCGEKEPLEEQDLRDFAALALEFIDHSIAQNRRQNGLFHSYNLIQFVARRLRRGAARRDAGRPGGGTELRLPGRRGLPGPAGSVESEPLVPGGSEQLPALPQPGAAFFPREERDPCVAAGGQCLDRAGTGSGPNGLRRARHRRPGALQRCLQECGRSTGRAGEGSCGQRGGCRQPV